MSAAAKNYLQDYYLTLPAAGENAFGTPVLQDCFGTCFSCFEATSGFEMSFDGSAWFAWNFGLAAQFPNQFTRLWFRSTSNAPNQIGFFAGNVTVINDQLNVVSDAGGLLAVQNKVPPTTLKTQNTVLAAGGQLIIVGQNNGLQRKDIYIFNLDANNTIAVANSGLTIGAPVYPQDNVVFETSDTVVLVNQNAAPVTVMVTETYYTS